MGVGWPTCLCICIGKVNKNKCKRKSVIRDFKIWLKEDGPQDWGNYQMKEVKVAAGAIIL
jgi:hypothetical protein